MKNYPRCVRRYTVLGERIVSLAGNRQMPIANALDVSQQTVSKKLRGETAILVSDLEELAPAFGVDMDYWFAHSNADPELAVAVKRFREDGSPYRDAAWMLAQLSPKQAEQAREIMVALKGAV